MRYASSGYTGHHIEWVKFNGLFGQTRLQEAAHLWVRQRNAVVTVNGRKQARRPSERLLWAELDRFDFQQFACYFGFQDESTVVQDVVEKE